MKAIKIYLDDEHYELLKGLAERKELSISAFAFTRDDNQNDVDFR